ncbi:HAD family phosphatase [Mesorhizobium sp. Z1-4]|uniref:HAD family hydrolase n=1 Tax=Mesorhizobium sp. Z1-4 TaxID=2448478 RepID=UPI000FD805B8|nr:HAD family phosphatase [Mesorhizobium sp. Z1-4]
MTDIRHIVFDIGRVLIHYDPEIPFRRLIPDAQTRHWFLENVCTGDWNLEQDRGRSIAEAEALLIGEFPAEEENIRAFYRHWNEMVSHAYDDSVAIMAALVEDGRDVTMLTNFSAETYPRAQKMFPFLALPRGVSVSGELGLIKPDREIYDHHVSAFGLEPSATLFIDDSQKNVDGAIAAGWHAVQFTGPEKLKADLAAHGVVV